MPSRLVYVRNRNTETVSANRRVVAAGDTDLYSAVFTEVTGSILAYNSDGVSTDTQTFTVPTDLEDGDFCYHLNHKTDNLDILYARTGWTEHRSTSGSGGSPDRGISTRYMTVTDAAAEIAGGTWEFTTPGADVNVGFVWIIKGVRATGNPIDSSFLINTSFKRNPFRTRSNTVINDNTILLSASTAGGLVANTPGVRTTAPPPHVSVGNYLDSPAVDGISERAWGAAVFWTQDLSGASTQDDYTMANTGVDWGVGEFTVALRKA